MTPILRHDSPAAQVWEGDCRAVAAGIEPGSCSLAVLDGPYAMQKAAWDKLKVADLPEWYAPHLDDVDRVCAPSASLYVWNTAEGWATLHPGIVGRGWTFRALVVWDKTVASITAYHARPQDWRKWKDQTEVCGFYQRAPDWSKMLRRAVNACPDSRAGICRSIGIDSRLLQFWEEGERFPSWELWRRAWEVLRGPFDVMPGVPVYHMQAGNGVRCATDKETHNVWKSLRPAFTCPMGIGNVWTHPPVAGPERLRGPDGSTLHPCQKPLAFADRILRASMRPGETAWVPFGGTLREAVAAERIARAEPHELRRVITAELNQDGVDYIGPALRQLRGEGTKRRDPRQGDMFARGEP